jgi:hypothetical protein
LARVIGTLAAAGDTQAPTQPQNLQATAINRQRVDLTWTASTDNVGVDGYQVFRDGSPLDIATGTTFSDTTATASTTYEYTVVAFDGAGNNSIASSSAQATTPANASPAWDTIATQTLIVGDSYSLNLNDVCSDADADTIEYSIPSGTLPSGISRSGAIISGTPTTAGENPTVTVRAFDGFVTADTDIEFETFTADTTAPPVPTGLSATAASSSQIDLSWNASTDAAGGANHYVSGTQDYLVYRSTDQTNFSLRTTVTGTSYQDTGLSATTRYDYKITARDVELNESAQSTAVNATTLTSSVSAALEADWQARIANSVWYHDFRSAAEVNQFRWANAYGQDPLDLARPGQTTWVADDGVTGGCLESRHNASGPPNPPEWWRPMCPLTAASNGRGVDDPAANGTLTLRTFSPTDGGDELLDLNNVGQYGPTAHHGDASFDGTEYWLQMRVKISANRATTGSGPSGDEGGKILYFTNTRRSNADQEIVTNSYYEVGSFGEGNNLFQMYRSGGAGLPDEVGTPNGRQIGGEYNGGVCTSSPLNSSGCWFWPDDETSEGDGKYVTLLYQIIPGTDSGNNTVVRVWKAEWGETSYTKIWDQSNVDLPYDGDMPRGHNAIICSGYQNEISFSEEVWHRYAQIIFSKQTIPCPQVYDELSEAPDWANDMSLNAWGPLGSDNFRRVQAADGAWGGNSGADAVFESWNSAAVVDYGDYGAMVFWGGGHDDYYGNEVYLFDLGTLLFSRLNEPSASGAPWPGTTFPNGLLPDGTPNVPHTYNFITSRGGEFITARRQVFHSPSTPICRVSRFNTSTLAWTNSLATHGIDPGQNDGVCYDQTRNGLWMLECSPVGWAFYDIDADVWTSYTAPTGNFGPGAGPVYVPGKDAVIFFPITTTARGLDPASPNSNPVNLPISGSQPAFSTGDMACWSANLGAIVYYTQGNSIYLFTPPAGDWRTGTWTWSQRSVSGSAGAHTGNGTFGKFQVVEWGSVTVCVVADDTTNAPRGVRLS